MSLEADFAPPVVRQITDEPKFAKFDASAGSTTVVAAVAGMVIRVVKCTLVVSGAATAVWKSNTTAITGTVSLAANGGISDGYTPVGLFQTVPGDPLVLTLTTSGGAGYLTYVLLRGSV